MARGFAAPVTSVFCASNDARAEAAIIDWLALYAEGTGPAGSMVAFDQPPVAWHAAAQRMTAVVEAARRAKAAHDSGMAAPSHTGGPTGDDTFKAGWFKPVPTAGRVDLGFAAGGDMLTPLSTVEFARAESIATRGDTPLAEVRRLCNMPGAIGAGCFAYIFSAGCAKGAVPKGIAASVVDARYQLLAWLEAKLEACVGEKRVDAVAEKITALASAIVAVRATKDSKVDEATCLYPLATHLLGGTPPAEEDGTNNDTVGQGTWGVRTGLQSAVDIPAAMAVLSRLLAAVHGLAGGGVMGKAGLAPGADGFGLTAMAKRACGSLDPDKVEEAMNDLFLRAQGGLARLRTRNDVAKLNWPELVEGLLKRKIVPLITEQRAEGAVARGLQAARASGRKSPRLDDDGDDVGSAKKISKRAQKKLDFVEKKKQELAAGKTTPVTKPKAAAPKASDDAIKVPGLDLAPSSITCLASKANHNGAVEALSKMYVARNPERALREQQPCPFVAIRHGTNASSDEVCKDGAEPGKCAQCDGWKNTPTADRVPYKACDVAAVKAACQPNIQKIFARLSLD